MNKSLFGSLKDKISRKPSTRANTSADNQRQPRSTTRQSFTMGNPFSEKHNREGEQPPPPYSPIMDRAKVTNDADEYAFLSTFDTIILIDDSGSMEGSRWLEVKQVLKAITPICTEHDEDGIDVYFLNNRSESPDQPKNKARGGYYNIKSADEVQWLFESVQPRYLTPTGRRLRDILKPYCKQLESSNDMDNVKPVNIIVITDGQASDDPESIIVENARTLDTLGAPLYQVGIQFFQVGDDPDARVALKELDDGLAHNGIRDMVDTVSWDANAPSNEMALSAEKILKIVLGGVLRRIDRQTPGVDGRRRT
ncbi:hypothetical protein S7711_05950 [Stachybotrys chartarum IBT 7711]|uniref:VWFA domain-containing protein n=1 Tax=Stachybotrys chartarum (strain CBS 109288 / IBT 7711) TaxID=1280523 RepID=A0A084AQ43_STACB|nr:hypothetical protein S7711_05950 [Stachybotrys chartarum IBT 7711]